METERITHPLNEQSIVFEIGGFIGHFSSEILAKYNCKMYIFEPVKEFYAGLVNKYQNNPNVKVFNFGFDELAGEYNLHVNRDATSLYSGDSANSENKVIIKNINDFFSEHPIPHIDLMEINCEGSEYSIIKSLANGPYITNIDRIQIQFHYIIPEHRESKESCNTLLSKTHEVLWITPGFECWKRKQ